MCLRADLLLSFLLAALVAAAAAVCCHAPAAAPAVSRVLVMLLLLRTCNEQLVQNVVRFMEVEDEVQLTHVAKVHVQHLAAQQQLHGS
jgi:hypothetical protein